MLRQGEGQFVTDISEIQLKVLISILSITSLTLFIGVRRSLAKIVILTDQVRRLKPKEIDKETISGLLKEEGEVADLARSFSGMISDLEDNINELYETKKTLHDVISKIGTALASVENFDMLISLILETIMNALAIRRGVIFSMTKENIIQVKASVGLDNLSDQEIIDSASFIINMAIVERKTIYVASVHGHEAKSNVFGNPLVCTPLKYKDELLGILCLSGNKRGDCFTDDEVRLISNLSFQIAVAFENAILNKNIEKTYFETMAALALAVEARDQYSRGHSERVGEFAAAVAQKMGLSREQIKTLIDASRLHDIGKIGISDNILNKPGKLTLEEVIIMHKHPQIGENIVKPLKTFNHLLEPIRHHHELLDGSGYPDGISGEQISLITRIITVVDIWDAMTTDRVYRKALEQTQAKEEVQKMVDQGKLDKEVVGVLFQLLKECNL